MFWKNLQLLFEKIGIKFQKLNFITCTILIIKRNHLIRILYIKNEKLIKMKIKLIIKKDLVNPFIIK